MMMPVCCNKCGLPAREFMQFQCPRCGEDARVSGLAQPVKPLVRAAELVWTVVVAVAILATVMFLDKKPYTLLSGGYGLNSFHGPVRMFAAASYGEGFAPAPSPNRITLSLLTRTGIAIEANAELPGGHLILRRAGTAVTTHLSGHVDQRAVDDLFRFAGIDPTKPDARPQAGEAMTAIGEVLRPQWRHGNRATFTAFDGGSSGGRSSSGERGANRWEPWLTAGFVGIWTVGLLALKWFDQKTVATGLLAQSSEMLPAVPDVATDDGRCGNCAYACAGLATTVCPECGCDLRVLGISIPGRAAGAKTRAVRYRWAAYVGIAGCALTIAAWFMLSNRSIRVIWTMPAFDKSNTAILTMDRSGSVWPLVVHQASLRFEPYTSNAPTTTPAPFAPQLEYADGRCGVPSLATPTTYSGPLTPGAVGAAMRLAGIDPSLPPYSIDADEWALRLPFADASMNNPLDLHVIGYGCTASSGSGHGVSQLSIGQLAWIFCLVAVWFTGDRLILHSRH